MDLRDETRDGGADITLVVRISQDDWLDGRGGVRVGDRDGPGRAVEFEVDVSGTVFVEVAETEVTDDEGLAVLDVDLVRLTDSQTVKEDVAAHPHDVAVFLFVLAVVFDDFRVQAPGDDHLVGGVRFELGDLFTGPVEVDGLEEFAGSAGDRLFAFQDDLLEVFREAPGGLAHHALEVGDDGVRIAEVRALLADVLGRQVVLDHEDGEVADHLGGRGDLDDAAEHVVDGLVHLLDFLEAVAEADGLDLRVQVRVLSSGDLIFIDVGDRGLESGIELLVASADILPVVGQFLETVEVQSGVSFLALERRDKGVHRGLGGQRGQRGDGDVDDVDTGLGGQQVHGDLVRCGVVRMEVDRQADFILERRDQLLAGIRFQKTGHVLDGDHVSAAFFELFRHIHIVFQSELVVLRVEDVARVADGRLTELALLDDFVHRHFHAGDPVEGVEDTEDVDARFGGLFDELADDVVGVVRVADGIGAAEKHLERDVRDESAQFLEALPRVLIEEAERGIERGAAPHLEGEGVGEDLGCAFRALQHVSRPHAGGEEGLVGVAHRGVRDKEFLLIEDVLGQRDRALFVEDGLEAGATFAGGFREAGKVADLAFQVGLRHLDVGDVPQHTCGAVSRLLDLEEFRGLIDELRRAETGLEGRMVEDLLDEGDVGLDAADMDFGQGAAGFADDRREARVPGRDLDEQGVVVR